MSGADNIAAWIMERSLKTRKQKITGDHLILAEIFELVCAEHNLRYETLLLTDSGLIASSNISYKEPSLDGTTINLEELANCPFDTIQISSDMGYTIVSSNHIR